MKKEFKLLFLSILAVCFFSLSASITKAQVDPNLRTRLQTNPIVVDHNSLGLFDQIPENYLQRARNIRVFFSDRSVGQNINESLDCLTATSWAMSPNSCRKTYFDTNQWCSRMYNQIDLNNGVVPQDIRFTPDPAKYNRSNIVYLFREGSWYSLTDNFISTLFPQNIASYDIVTYQFSYLNIGGNTNEQPNIANPLCGFMVTQNRAGCHDSYEPWHIGRITELESQYINKAFIYWTTSYARSIGAEDGEGFNNQMRSFASSNHKILFDFADIISHTPGGVSCYDNRDGVAYVRKQEGVACTPMTTFQENYPDDGQNYPAICQNYTVEQDNGHLTLGGGLIRSAKAYWILLAQIAGWVPGQQQITATPTQTVTSTRTPTPTFTPIPSYNQADANSDGRVDGVDYVIWLSHFNQNTSWGRLDGDFNSDGVVNGLDYVIWVNNYSS